MNYAGIIIENVRGQILFQLRDNKPNLLNSNLWSIFGGGIEKGETPKEAAVREIYEELGIKIKQEELRIILIVPTSLAKLNYIYGLKTDARFNKAKLKEGAKMQYLSINEFLRKKNVVPSLRTFLKVYKLFGNFRD